MRIIPLKENVVVTIPPEKRGKLLIYRDEQKSGHYSIGKAVFTGPDSQVKPGDTVFFNRWEPKGNEIEGLPKHYILRGEHIHGTIKNPPKRADS